MKIKYLNKFLYICMLVCLTPGLSQSAIRHDSIVFSNGKLSASLRQASFNDIITLISEKAGIQIYIFDDTDDRTLTVEITDRSLESGLRSILREVSHTVVYQSGMAKGNVEWVENLVQRKKAVSGKTRPNGARRALSVKRTPPGNRDIADRSTGLDNNYITEKTYEASNKKNHIKNRYSTGTQEVDGNPSGNFAKNSNISEKTYNNYVASEYYRTMSPAGTQDRSNEVSAFSNIEEDSEESSGDYYQEEDATELADSSYEDENTDDFYDPADSNEESFDDESEGNSDEEEYASSEYDEVPSWYYEGMPREEAELRYKIDMLEKQIDSGYADKQYERWVAVRGEKIVRHASELLEEYEDQLEIYLNN